VAMLTVSMFDYSGGVDRALLALRSIQARQLIDLLGEAAVVSWPEGRSAGAPSPSGTHR
jgi:uncharacterized membrane protein